MPGGRGRRVLHVRYLVSGRPRTRWYRCTSYSVPHMRDRISVYGRKVDVFATSFMYELNAYQVLSPLVTNGTHFNEYTNNTPSLLHKAVRLRPSADLLSDSSSSPDGSAFVADQDDSASHTRKSCRNHVSHDDSLLETPRCCAGTTTSRGVADGAERSLVTMRRRCKVNRWS